MVDAGTRSEILKEVEAIAQKIFDGADSMKIVSQTDTQTVQIEWQNDSPVMHNTLSVDGVFVADYKAFTENYMENIIPIAGSKAQYVKLESDGGHTCVHQRVIAGVPFVSNRSLIITYYYKTEGDDHIFIVSTRGNKHLEEKYKDQIGSDVIATLDVNYMRFSPKLDSCGDVCGTEIKQVVITNPNGSLLDALKTKLTQFQSQVLVQITEAIRAKK